MWTEDYQVATLKQHFKAFDYLRKQGFFIGEMIWNFADFLTNQGEYQNMAKLNFFTDSINGQQ